MGRPRFARLYRIDTRDNLIGSQPVGKMFLDMIILDFNILLEQDLALTDKQKNPVEGVDGGGFWSTMDDTEGVMYGFAIQYEETITDADGADELHIDNSGWDDRAEILAARNSEGYPYGIFKDTGFCRGPRWPNDNGGIFIKKPISAAFDFYFPEHNFPRGEGVNDLHLLTYFMDPVQVKEVLDKERGSTKIGIDRGGNYMYVKDYNKLLKLWYDTPLIFNSINVEVISR